VELAMKKINNGKAPDGHGIQTEHIRKAGVAILKPLAHLFNLIMLNRRVPDEFKKGVVIPIPKKDKNQLIQENYRGITLTCTIGKVFENVLLGRMRPVLEPKYSQLQRGFTAGTSSLSAALLVSELTNEAKDLKEDLFIATLEWQTTLNAFLASSLLRKLHLQEVQPEIWSLLKHWYDGATSQVKWKNKLSDPFELFQGVHQGRATSTELYKC
jgi:hypothetical protein